MISLSISKRLAINLCLSLGFCMVATQSLAALTSARANPQTLQILKNKEAGLNVVWQIAADASTADVVSPPGEIINPKDGAVLTGFGTTLNQSGASPFVMKESITIPTRVSDAWFDAGLKSVILRRNFSDPAGGGAVSARVTLRLTDSSLSSLRDSAPGELSIHNLRLEYPNGNDVIVVDTGEALRARLTLGFTGTGLLEGRWQLAEPNSNGEAPVFRTLALVRKNIHTNQRFELNSPELPTDNPGRFLLQFCVTNTGASNVSAFCQEDLSARSAYQVQGDRRLAVKRIQGISPSNKEVNESTPFTWQALPNTSMYQLQIFSLSVVDDTLPSSKEDGKLLEPRFLVGMMLPKEQTLTRLSDLVRDKLKDGQRYLWRLSAIDISGRLIGVSEEASFTYQD